MATTLTRGVWRVGFSITTHDDGIPSRLVFFDIDRPLPLYQVPANVRLAAQAVMGDLIRSSLARSRIELPLIPQRREQLQELCNFLGGQG